MKTVDLAEERLDLEAIITLVREGPVLLLTPGGKEFFVSAADDFEKEVEMLRASRAFQRFLDERSGSKRRTPLEEIEREIEQELEGQKTS